MGRRTGERAPGALGKRLARFVALEAVGNRAGVAYMLAAVVAFSLLPLVVALSDGGSRPFLFNAWLRVGYVAGLLGFVGVTLARSTERGAALAVVWEQVKDDFAGLTGPGVALNGRIVSAALLLCVIANFEFALFALAVRRVDVGVAAVLYEIWPILSIFATAALIRGRYDRINAEGMALLAMCFVGVGFVVVSQSGTIVIAGALDTLVGGLMALAAVMLAALYPFGFRWGRDVAERAKERLGGQSDKAMMELLYVIVAFAVSGAVVIPVNFLIGFVAGEGGWSGSYAAFAVLGGFVMAAGVICLRQANVVVTNLGVNAIAYGTPILSLAWLFGLSLVRVQRPDYLVIGAAAVVVANLWLNLRVRTVGKGRWQCS